MNYSYPQIVLQEVPGEISLALSISGCSLHCKGCHSSETWDPNFGENLNKRELQRLIDKNTGISCVLFYGGEWAMPELLDLIRVVKLNNLKVALYTGEELEYFSDNFLRLLDYIKVGRYIQELGNLKSKKTNQRFIKIREYFANRNA